MAKIHKSAVNKGYRVVEHEGSLYGFAHAIENESIASLETTDWHAFIPLESDKLGDLIMDIDEEHEMTHNTYEDAEAQEQADYEHQEKQDALTHYEVRIRHSLLDLEGEPAVMYNNGPSDGPQEGRVVGNMFLWREGDNYYEYYLSMGNGSTHYAKGLKEVSIVCTA